MESYTPESLDKRKSQKLGFGDFAKDSLLWGALPLLTGAAGVAIGRTLKIYPFNGHPDLLTLGHVKIAEYCRMDKEFVQWVKDGVWGGAAITRFGGENKELLRKDLFNFTKAADAGLAVSLYHVWHKEKGQRLDFTTTADQLRAIQNIRPTDAELAEQNSTMKKELAFAASQPSARVDASSVTPQGRVSEKQKAIA